MRGHHDDGITCGVYKPTTDNTLKDLKTFRDFLYRDFKDHLKNEKMLPILNQPVRLYGTAKTHKFASPNIITTGKLKFRPIIAQNGTYKLLVDENPYIIRNTQDFPSILKVKPPLETDEEYVSNDVESLFTNIPVRDNSLHPC